jgi:anti-anti-sigma factor
MRLVETDADGVMVVEAHGRLDSTTSKAFGDRLTSLLETGHGALVVDLKSIAYISSVGFQALLKASRAAAGLGCKLALCGVTEFPPLPLRHPACGRRNYVVQN